MPLWMVFHTHLKAILPIQRGKSNNSMVMVWPIQSMEDTIRETYFFYSMVKVI